MVFASLCPGTLVYLFAKYVLGTMMCIPQVVLVSLWGHTQSVTLITVHCGSSLGVNVSGSQGLFCSYPICFTE